MCWKNSSLALRFAVRAGESGSLALSLLQRDNAEDMVVSMKKNLQGEKAGTWIFDMIRPVLERNFLPNLFGRLHRFKSLHRAYWRLWSVHSDFWVANFPANRSSNSNQLSGEGGQITLL